MKCKSQKAAKKMHSVLWAKPWKWIENLAWYNLGSVFSLKNKGSPDRNWSSMLLWPRESRIYWTWENGISSVNSIILYWNTEGTVFCFFFSLSNLVETDLDIASHTFIVFMEELTNAWSVFVPDNRLSSPPGHHQPVPLKILSTKVVMTTFDDEQQSHFLRNKDT